MEREQRKIVGGLSGAWIMCVWGRPPRKSNGVGDTGHPEEWSQQGQAGQIQSGKAQVCLRQVGEASFQVWWETFIGWMDRGAGHQNPSPCQIFAHPHLSLPQGPGL